MRDSGVTMKWVHRADIRTSKGVKTTRSRTNPQMVVGATRELGHPGTILDSLVVVVQSRDQEQKSLEGGATREGARGGVEHKVNCSKSINVSELVSFERVLGSIEMKWNGNSDTWCYDMLNVQMSKIWRIWRGSCWGVWDCAKLQKGLQS